MGAGDGGNAGVVGSGVVGSIVPKGIACTLRPYLSAPAMSAAVAKGLLAAGRKFDAGDFPAALAHYQVGSLRRSR
jgi:hypothetical protein